MVIFTTDRGLMIGEHGHLGKNACHAWNEIARIPLLVHLPGGKAASERRQQLTKSVDLFSTLAEYFSADPERPARGRSFVGITRDEIPSLHEAVLFRWYGKTINVTDGRHVYFRFSPAQKPKSVRPRLTTVVCKILRITSFPNDRAPDLWIRYRVRDAVLLGVMHCRFL